MQVLKIAIFVMVASGLIGIISLPPPTRASNIEVAGIYSASLSGDSEIPEVNTQASGEARFESNAQAAALGDAAAAASSGSQLVYEITLRDIEEVTAAHIHSGDSNENGPIVVTLFDPDKPTGAINGELVRSVITADNLEGQLENKQISDLVDLFESGQAYVNVHTQTNPDGEIRGTIQQG
jgi:hypothetical protein